MAAVREELEQLRQQERQWQAEQQLLREQLATVQKGKGSADRLGLQLGLVGLTAAAAAELGFKGGPPRVSTARHRHAGPPPCGPREGAMPGARAPPSAGSAA